MVDAVVVPLVVQSESLRRLTSRENRTVSKRFVITMTAANRVGILAATTTAIADLGS